MDFMEKHKDRIFFSGGEQNPLPLFGIDVGPGWIPLIEKLADELCEIDTNNIIRFVQIKQKFGGLRFYTDHVGNDRDRDLWQKEMAIISKYEKLAEVTCERCGQPGICRNTGWRMTLCDDHYKEYLSKKGA